jgi:hypothetical protein
VRVAPPSLELPAPWALALLAVWVALLLLAPAGSNWVWAVNGFRSVPLAARVGLLVAAAATTLLVLPRRHAGGWWAAFAALLAATLAFPLRDRIHVLGDADLRIRAMIYFRDSAVHISFVEWAQRLHTNFLDFVFNFLVPIGAQRLLPSVLDGVSVASLLLAAAFFAGVWRLSSRLGAPPAAQLALCAALVLAGTLELFAGYAESTGLLLAAATWWWAEALAPLDSLRPAARGAAAWLVLFLSHRLALALLPAQLWRALGPPLEGDRPGPRRLHLAFTALAVVAAGGVFLAGGGARVAGADFQELLAAVRGEGGVHAVAAHDALNLLALLAPLALLGPALAGGGAVAAFARRPEAWLVLVAAVPLLPFGALAPVAPSGLGAQRDWDLNALLGWTLTLGAAGAMARLPLGRLRGALLLALPALGLLAGSWVAVNAHEMASVRRALVMASREPLMPAPQQSHLLGYLGQRAMDRDQPQLASRYYERAFDLNPNPRVGLLAAEAWAVAREFERSRAVLERARARAIAGGDRAFEGAARMLDSLLARLPADSAAARAAPPR